MVFKLHYTMKLIILMFQISGQVGGACVPIIQMSQKSVICNLADTRE